MKKAFILVALLLAVFIGNILMFENNTPSEEEPPYIAVTSFPLFEIADKLVGEKIAIKKLIPFGLETHTYMPSVKTMTEISGARLVLFTGVGLEPWIKKEYTNALDMSRSVRLNDIDEAHDEEDDHDHDGHQHGAEGVDPHYWLDIDNMIRMTEFLSEKLGNKFSEHKPLIENNARAYIKALKNLKEEFGSALKSCKRDEIVVNHNAFGYLAKEYGFSVHALTGLSPDEQVSAKRMKEITDLVREEGVTTVFFESFISPKSAQTISNETGVQVQSLQPLANVTQDEAARGYIALMQENLKKLSTVLECE